MGRKIKKFFSDERLKENVRKVYEIGGLNIYEYNYLGSNTLERGVMAQEVLNSDYASAVEIHANGFYQVDYGKLPFNI